jgi:hypothetical protein
MKRLTGAAGCRAAWRLRMAGRSEAEIAQVFGLGSEECARVMTERGAILVMDDLWRLRRAGGLGICLTRRKGRERKGGESGRQMPHAKGAEDAKDL